MLPAAKRSTLIYALANDAEHVNVYDYANGQLVGTISGGFSASAGCVDATGNVYIVADDGNAYEYAHGGTTPINSYGPGGDLVGCSVDAGGDLAISASAPAPRIATHRARASSRWATIVTAISSAPDSTPR
jgi:hypothetical protein